jgi:hypothetical protein
MNALVLMMIVAAQVFSYPALDPDKLFFYSDGKPTYLQLVQNKAIVRFQPEKENDVRRSLGRFDTLSVIPWFGPVPEALVYGVVEFGEKMSEPDALDRVSALRANSGAVAVWPVFTIKNGYGVDREIFLANTFYISFKEGIGVQAAAQVLTANGATAVSLKTGANGRVRCEARVTDQTPMDVFLSIANRVCTLPEVRYAKPDIFPTAPSQRFLGPALSDRAAMQSGRQAAPTSVATQRNRATVQTATATAGPQWGRVVPVYYGFQSDPYPPCPPVLGHGEERALVDNPSKNCNSVMVSSQEIYALTNADPDLRECFGTDITYELDNGVLVGADVGVWGRTWNEYIDYCVASVTAGVYMICTDEMLYFGVMALSDFDDLYTNCKAENSKVLVGIYEVSYSALSTFCESLHASPPSGYGYYPDFIGLNWDIGGGGYFDSLVQYAHGSGMRAIMYFWGPPTSAASNFYKTYYQADAVFIWATSPVTPWGTQVKPFVDEHLGAPCLKIRSGSTDVAMIDKKGNLVLNGTAHGNQTLQVMSSVSPPEFIVRNHSGQNVLRITNAGDLFLKGYVSQEYDVGSISASPALRVEDDRAVCTQDGELYISGSTYEHGKP